MIRPHTTFERLLLTAGLVALMLGLAGWGLWLANLWALVLGFVFVPYMNRFQIRPEERALERQFGQSFQDYCRRVRRWL